MIGPRDVERSGGDALGDAVDEEGDCAVAEFD